MLSSFQVSVFVNIGISFLKVVDDGNFFFFYNCLFIFSCSKFVTACHVYFFVHLYDFNECVCRGWN